MAGLGRSGNVDRRSVCPIRGDACPGVAGELDRWRYTVEVPPGPGPTALGQRPGQVGPPARVAVEQLIGRGGGAVDPPQVEMTLPMPRAAHRSGRAVGHPADLDAGPRSTGVDRARAATPVWQDPEAEPDVQVLGPGPKERKVENRPVPGADDARIEHRKTLIEDRQDPPFAAVVVLVPIDGADAGGDDDAACGVEDIDVVRVRFVRQSVGIDNDVQPVDRRSDQHV